MKNILVTLTIFASLLTANVASTNIATIEKAFVSASDGEINILDDDRSHNGHL
ncbi:hypothetical protein [Alkalicoccobacillus gibsonii]|jgi:hypothetical protein|uniref:hypothetical protein n=1 Tax=Alkalicoccobacillus gibsonii TaxID=79881 RepID=UPI001933F42D|nr:hypothetical protein [Alkalicoccobacillus gibsonii]MBM0067918.1 hypothetical protein [Alkalicoccobacillus gibsonii]